MKYNEEQRKNTRLYDFISFHSLLIYVYQIEDFNEAIKKPPKKYRDELKPYYDLSFLDENKKL